MDSYIRVLAILTVLLLASGLATLYWSGKHDLPERVAERVAERLESQLISMDETASGLAEEFKTNPAYELPPNADFSFYVIANYRVVRWNDHHFVPSVASVQDEFSIRFLKDGNSDYVARKWNISQGRFLVGVITLSRKFPITNNYLKPEWNRKIFPRGNLTILDPSADAGFPVCVNGICPFKINFVPGELNSNEGGRLAGSALMLLGIIASLMLLYEMLKRYFIPDVVFVGLLAAMVISRLLMAAADFPAGVISGELFNHQVFASSDFNASLGDLLINEVALFFLCYYLFKNFFRFRSIRFMLSRPQLRWVLSVASAWIVFFALLFPFVVVQTIYNNSTIPLAISETLQFDGLRIAATVAVVLSGLCTFLFSHCFIRLLIGDGNRIRIFVSIIFGLLGFIVANIISGQLFWSTVIVTLVYFVVVYVLRLTASLRRLSFATFTYLFVSVFVMAVNAGYAMHYFSWQEKISNMFRFGSNYIVDRDYFAEYLLDELSNRISNDAFIKSRVATPFLGKDAVKQKIRQVFLPSYFNKFDVEIFTFNASGQATDNRAGLTITELLASYQGEASQTDYEGVYIMNSPSVDVTQKYLVTVPITWMRAVAGYVVVEFSLKKVIPENVYPELLVDNRFLESFRAEEISYGVFANNKLVYSSGPFNYEALFNTEWFGDPALHTQGIQANGFDHIAEEDDGGRIAIVSSRQTPVEYSIANFSFLLVIGLGAILIFILIQSITSFWRRGNLYFSARIQLFLNLAFFLPLIIVSLMSLRLTNRSSENQILEEYLDKSRNFAAQVSEGLHRHLVSSFEPLENFSGQLTELTQLADLEANVYYVTGTLLATSQPLIFENKLLSEYINPVAFRNMKNGANQFIETEHVGTLEYFTAYAALKAPSSGAVIGIVGIPFFQSVYSTERIQISVLANILNIFSLIFIVLVALSYFVTQWLTFPLTFITQSLRRTSLTRTNEPLVWKADDEIGLMVKEYNQMLYSLSESKAELEQTQRERAWRDMAQQVAHEIKNPLTPMKLTLQQLERSLENGKAGPEKIQKAIASLLIQVNTLNDIASSFSAFAKMPEPVMKPLELVSLLRRIVDLHSQSGELKTDIPVRELWVVGDEQMLGRTFSNLILNALQSAIPGEAIRVIISVNPGVENVTIAVQDNGKGIEPELAERIFIPHFTTKRSGSGLGLAIARQSIEHMHGKLWFTTEVGKGTTFFVQLPRRPEVT